MVLELLGTDLERIIFSKRRNETDEHKSPKLVTPRDQKIKTYQGKYSLACSGIKKGLHSKGYAHLDIIELTNLMN